MVLKLRSLVLRLHLSILKVLRLRVVLQRVFLVVWRRLEVFLWLVFLEGVLEVWVDV